MGFSSTEYQNRHGRRPGVNASAFSINVDLQSVNAMIDGLQADVQAAVRPASQAGAQVIYARAVQNVEALGEYSGRLIDSIYQAYSKERSGPAKAVYGISWNYKTAPHGHLVEFGHIARYAVYVGKDGKWHTAIRPEARGKSRPGRRASQAAKDKYYILRKGGPKQIPPKAFMRRAASEFPAAADAMTKTFFDLVGAK